MGIDLDEIRIGNNEQYKVVIDMYNITTLYGTIEQISLKIFELEKKIDDLEKQG